MTTEHRKKSQREYAKKYHAKRLADPSYVARRNGYNLKCRSGWTPQLREDALSRQGGLCAICPRELGAEPNCDHCHVTKKPRGLLCRACNISLGYYEKWQRPAGLVIEPYETYLVA